jgi:hypothetical protein
MITTFMVLRKNICLVLVLYGVSITGTNYQWFVWFMLQVQEEQQIEHG